MLKIDLSVAASVQLFFFDDQYKETSITVHQITIQGMNEYPAILGQTIRILCLKSMITCPKERADGERPEFLHTGVAAHESYQC